MFSNSFNRPEMHFDATTFTHFRVCSHGAIRTSSKAERPRSNNFALSAAGQNYLAIVVNPGRLAGI